MVNPLKLDPTRTTTLRRQFMGEMKKRFRNLRSAVWQLVAVEDAFGIKANKKIEKARDKDRAGIIANERWRFDADDAKLDNYRSWLSDQVDKEILSVDPDNIGKPWTQKYIKSAYQKGVTRAYIDTNKQRILSSTDLGFVQGGKEAFLNASFSGAVAQSKLNLIGTRAFTQLKGITAEMDKEMTRILTNGLASGHGAKKIARDMTKAISGLEKKRALVIARTEIVYAHNEGQLDSFEAMNVQNVGVMAEWSTAGDDLVCPLCSPLDGVVLTVREARGIIPRHPNCRCAWIPANVGENLIQGSEGQKFSEQSVAKKFRKSLKAEHPKLSSKQARIQSKWLGADKKISGKVKPKPGKFIEATVEKQAKTASKLATVKKAKVVSKAKKTAVKVSKGDAVVKAVAKKAVEKQAPKKVSEAHKLLLSKAKKNYAKKKYGIVDDDWTDASKTKLAPSGVNKVLAKKDLSLATVEKVTADALDVAEDVVAQKEILQAVKKTTKTKVPRRKKVETKVVPETGDILPIEGAGFKRATKFEDTGETLGGSTGAKKVKTTNGDVFVMKDYSGKSLQAENEFLANSIYNAISKGSAPKTRLGLVKNRNGGTSSALFTEFQEGGTELGKLSPMAQHRAYKKAQENFVVDGWLANWDAVGQGADNMMLVGEKVVRIDNGGSLLFRAKGGLKGSAFGNTVGELDSLLKPSLNPSAAEVYKGITDKQIVKQIKKLEKKIAAKGGVEAFLKENGIDQITDIARRTEIAKALEQRLSHLTKIRHQIENPSVVPLSIRHQNLAEVAIRKTNTTTKSSKITANKALGKARADLSRHEYNQINRFTGGSYRDINRENLRELRKGELTSETVTTINKGLSKLPGYKGTLGRGQDSGVTAEMWNNYKKGDWAQVYWNCPSSTSAKPSRVFGSGGDDGVMYIIRSKGKRNAWVMDISMHELEHEALYMGDSAFRVVGFAEGQIGTHKRFLVIDELDVGQKAPTRQVAPKELDADELWAAFNNDAKRAGMQSTGEKTGPSVTDLIDKAKK